MRHDIVLRIKKSTLVKNFRISSQLNEQFCIKVIVDCEVDFFIVSFVF